MKRIKFNSIICFENDSYIAVNKPSGIASLHEHIGENPSIIELAKQHHPELQLCHRIDKDTSGILLLAKNPAAYRHASIQFEKRQVTKTYHAVAQGVHNFSSLELTLPVHTTRSGRASIDANKGKPSTTVFDTLEHFRHFTLVACKPVSGRLHQIRIHLASQNAPIAGDEIYGGEIPYLSKLKSRFSLPKDKEENPMIRRFALHAFSLEFTQESGEQLNLKAPYPKDLAVFLKLLNKYDS